MYSVVLATVLAAGGDATAFHHGCHGCHGCYGCSCYGGCYGCHGCHGCCGGYGCSCYGCYGCSCYGCSCWGSYCSGCYGCSCSCSCWGSYSVWGCYGCYGCSCYGSSCYGCGGVVVAPMAVASAAPAAPAAGSGSAPTTEEFDSMRREIESLKQQLRKQKTEKSDLLPPEARASQTPAAARIRVLVPRNARLWVDQVECPLTSTVRSFSTPPLQPNQKYVYTLRAEVQRDGETLRASRRVEIAAGRQVDVDFMGMEKSMTTAQR